MSVRLKLSSWLVLAALALPGTASAATFGAETYTLVAECTFACIVKSQSLVGGEGTAYAETAVADEEFGSARARAVAGGAGLALPDLGAEGLSLPGGAGTSRAAAMRHYRYTGPGSTFSLLATLDGEISQGDGGANIAAYIAVVEAPDLAFDIDYTAFTPTIVQLPATATLLAAESTNFFAEGFSDLGPQTATFDITFDLETGDSVYLLAYLAANGSNGGNASAYGSLSLDFTAGDLAGLTGSPVPLPAAGWLLLSAFAPLARRRSRASN